MPIDYEAKPFKVTRLVTKEGHDFIEETRFSSEEEATVFAKKMPSHKRHPNIIEISQILGSH